MLDPNEALFLGIGKSSVLWYRCALPAIHLGADWCGIRGTPPNVQVMTGLVRGDTVLPNYGDYKIVVLQEPYGKSWLRKIHELRAAGIKVLYEVDDYLHGVAKQQHHDFAKGYGKEQLRDLEMCMRACDGMIVSTEYIARRYARYNKHIYVCRNGIDLSRYALTRPERSTVNIGWAGATGHTSAIIPWINAILPVLHERPDTCFVAIGSPGLAQPVNEILKSDNRAIGIPFAPLECYPAAMCMLDIALAPSTDTTWYRGKSDLRWLEAAALGVPIVADPVVYPEIEHGVTGFHAKNENEAQELVRELVEDDELRRRVGQQAHDYVVEHRSSETAAMQWHEVLGAVVGEHESLHQLQRS